MRKVVKPLLVILPICVFYLLVSIYIMNIQLVKETLFGSYSLDYKFRLMFSLIGGLWTANSWQYVVLDFTIAFLTGINIYLISENFSSLKNSFRMHLLTGSGSLMAVLGGSCLGCGLPLLSFLGVFGGIFYLPIKGIGISIIPFISLGLLVLSMIILLRTKKDLTCNVNLV